MELELIQRNDELRRMSSIDALTNLINHRVLYEKLNEMMTDQSKDPLSIAMFDLDDFKKINDQYGHIFGDRILREVSDVLQGYTAADVLAGRYGGEEFLVILPNHTTQDAYEIAERIRSIIESKYASQPYKLTISGGVSTYVSGTAAELIHRADVLLYEAKKMGKNRIMR
jgi:diguanylate cyclase (GGDEF)-like protein